ncbi:hypothetical protein B0H63DRAFT_145127 [Podospora didyma]|uniref:Zn(2)-C6 fungal-type domain-containing protein n=1 Tax=Podospora didyma TaxID=330526 RepID=A0AAE0NSP8_9PEZI|nr:hypothetical protein B0H63DRAFT_145127 [Podospora didyma]
MDYPSPSSILPTTGFVEEEGFSGGLSSSGSSKALETSKPYYTKRPHRKSRTGCRNCKRRKVKCDEARPTCRPCSLRGETCDYRPPPFSSTSQTSSTSLEKRPTHGVSVVTEPLFIPPERDEVDMRLLWFYTTTTYKSLSPSSGKELSIDNALTVKIVEHAFSNPFLMNCVLSFASMHLQHLGQEGAADIPRNKSLVYRVKAFEGYRKAVERADPATFPALVVGSLLLCGLTTQMFRGEEATPLYILDWLIMWRGVGSMVFTTRIRRTHKSGLEVLFFRPAIDMDLAAQYIPINLLFMVASVTDDDDIDFPAIDAYHTNLKYLGSLYAELRNSGFHPILHLRVSSILSRLSLQFINVARKRQPRALIIVAYFLAFLKFVKNIWWLSDIGDGEIQSISKFLGPAYDDLLRVPLATVGVTDYKAVARILLEDPSWEPPEGYPRGPDGSRRLVWPHDNGVELHYDPVTDNFTYHQGTEEVW